MIVYTGDSSWGIKESGRDISNDIIGIVQNATDFIVAGGYNFDYRSVSGAAFFGALRAKAAAGVPVLMLMPPTLYGSGSQAKIYDTLIIRDIGVILNAENHSKWILSEKTLYYGSSNFSQTSWQKKIEVVTFHHNLLSKIWKRNTVNDFYKFLDKEINAFIRNTFYFGSHAALVSLTITKWNNIKVLIKKLNPSVERVRETLGNIEAAELILLSVLQDWVLKFAPETVEHIYGMCYRIWQSIVALAQYSYANIYNEVEDQQEVADNTIIDQYNDLFRRFIETLDSCIDELQSGPQSIIRRNELKSKNDGLIRKFLSVLQQNPGFESGESDVEQ